MAELTQVFNLTDVPTPLLEKFGMVGVPLVLGTSIIPAGGACEVRIESTVTAAMQHYLSIGAIAVGKLPAGYALSKGTKPASEDSAFKQQFVGKKKKKGK